MKITAEKKNTKHCQSARVTNVPNLFVSFSVPFSEHIKATTKP